MSNNTFKCKTYFSLQLNHPKFGSSLMSHLPKEFSLRLTWCPWLVGYYGTREISRGACKLARTPSLSKKNKKITLNSIQALKSRIGILYGCQPLGNIILTSTRITHFPPPSYTWAPQHSIRLFFFGFLSSTLTR